MKIKDYQKLALRTEAPINEDILSRVKDPQTAVAMMLNLQRAFKTGVMLDGMKSVVFYGAEKPKGVADVDVDPKSIEYAAEAQNEQTMRIIHGILGIMSEGGEMTKAICDFIYADPRTPIDEVNIIEECGDTLWFINLILTAVGSSIPQAMERNIAKLQKRFPSKFTEEAALNRNLDEERKALEGETPKIAVLPDPVTEAPKAAEIAVDGSGNPK